MPKCTKPSYIAEYELSPVQQDGFTVLYHAEHEAHNVYNMCLSEALKRLNKVRHSVEYKELCKQLKEAQANNLPLAKIAKQIRQLYTSCGYSEYALHAYVAIACRKYVNLGIDEKQKLATRAFRAVEKIRTGDAGSVRFVRKDDCISFEGKSKNSRLHFKKEHLSVCFGRHYEYKLNINPNDEYAMLCLTDRCKYVRIIKRIIRGKERWHAQLMMEGTPPSKKRTLGEEAVGLDLGVSTLAVASEDTVELIELAPDCPEDEKKIRRIQRAMDRSRRSTNPDNINSDGTISKGRHIWKKSKHYMKLKYKLKEHQRQVASKRKQSHEKLANHIVSLGDDIRVEQMSMKGLSSRSKKTSVNKKNGKIRSKKRYGKTIGNRAPAMLVSIIDRKLGYHGKHINKVNTWTVKASQYNPLDGTYRKKDMKERLTKLNENIIVQRDMLSAYVIQHTNDTYDSVNEKSAYKDFDNFKAMQNVALSKLAKENELSWYTSIH